MAFGRNNSRNPELLEESQNIPNENTQDTESTENVYEQNTNFKEAATNEEPNIVDGWKVIDNYDLPFHGKLYPATWKFAYRCPKAKEVVAFSTIDNNDTPAIYSATEDLIKKCVKIWDTDTEREVSSTEINDSDRLFFMMKLREFYIPDENQAIKIPYVCNSCYEESSQVFTSDSLIFVEPNDILLDAFDGRVFNLEMECGVIKFRIPTLSTSGKLFKFMIQVIRDNQNQRRESERRDNKIVYNKSFLKIAPYLFITGKENVHDIIEKFRNIEKNDDLFETYMSIIDDIKLFNLEYIETKCEKCGSEDTVDISFPAWRKFFKKSLDTKGYFRKN